jgi:hypothetical protein
VTPEGKTKAKVREIFKAHGVGYAHIPASQFGRAGVGDYICCVRGIYLEVEVKAGKNTQTAPQVLRGEEVMEAGGLYIVVNEHRVKALEALIEALKIQTYLAALPAIQKAFYS